jgi:hypothetical protein
MNGCRKFIDKSLLKCPLVKARRMREDNIKIDLKEIGLRSGWNRFWYINTDEFCIP